MARPIRDKFKPDAARVARARNRSGLSQEQLTAKVNEIAPDLIRDDDFISYLENARAELTPDLIRAIAQACEVSVAELLEDEPAPRLVERLIAIQAAIEENGRAIEELGKSAANDALRAAEALKRIEEAVETMRPSQPPPPQ